MTAEFKPTRPQRTIVCRMLACGDSQETVARAIGVSVPTLRKHFASELDTGAARVRRWAVAKLFAGAAKGNAALIRRVEEITRLAVAADEIEGPQESALGKKAAAQRDAAAVAGGGSEWGDDLSVGSAAIN